MVDLENLPSEDSYFEIMQAISLVLKMKKAHSFEMSLTKKIMYYTS